MFTPPISFVLLAVMSGGIALPSVTFAATTNKPATTTKVATTSKPAMKEPDLKSGSVLVVDEKSGSVLLSQQADVAAPIASITKLMTALVVLEAHQSMDEVIQITA